MVLDYVKVLVWPAVVAGLLIGYRRTARRLLTRLTQLDAGGVSVTFDAAAREAATVTGSDPDTEPVLDIARGSRRVTPTGYTEVREIGELYRDGHVVLLDLTETEDDVAKRLVDFCAGIVFQNRGSIEKVVNKVFLLNQADTPS